MFWLRSKRSIFLLFTLKVWPELGRIFMHELHATIQRYKKKTLVDYSAVPI